MPLRWRLNKIDKLINLVKHINHGTYTLAYRYHHHLLLRLGMRMAAIDYINLIRLFRRNYRN